MPTFVQGYPLKNASPNRTEAWVRLTVGTGPVFTNISSSLPGITFTDETGTGAYALRMPGSGKNLFVQATVCRAGGSSVLTTLVRCNDLPVANTGVATVSVYGLTVASGVLALADLVDGDVVDFHISTSITR
jgi:hypothetical protein